MPDYVYEWKGEKVGQDVATALVRAFMNIRPEALELLKEQTPHDTGFLQSTSYIDIVRGGAEESQPSMEIGQRADYALYVELGTRFTPGHFQITNTAVEVARLLPTEIGEFLHDSGYGSDAGHGSAGPTGPGLPNPHDL